METNKCQLSIVIPVFNGSNEINICLDSIYSQGMSPEQFEVICVDDCSTDSTVEVIEDYANRMQPGNLKIIRHNVNKRQGGGEIHYRKSLFKNLFGINNICFTTRTINYLWNFIMQQSCRQLNKILRCTHRTPFILHCIISSNRKPFTQRLLFC